MSVSYAGVQLKRPYVTEVVVMNTGRHAIGSDLFDRKRPIEVDLHASIVAVAQTDSVPAEFARASSDADSVLQIGPELLQPGCRIRFHVVTEGEPHAGDLRHYVSGASVIIKTELRSQRDDRVAQIVSTTGALTGAISALLALLIK